MKKFIATFVLTFVFTSYMPSTYAITRPVLQNQEERQERREEIASQRCTILTTNIDTRITRFNNNKQRHIDRYNNINERVAKFIAQAREQGYDVAKLEADGKTLDQKVQKFASDYAAFISKLEATKSSACGESEGAFRGALQTARQQLAVVRQDSVDIRNYYQTVIRQDIQDLRNQKVSPTPAQ